MSVFCHELQISLVSRCVCVCGHSWVAVNKYKWNSIQWKITGSYAWTALAVVQARVSMLWRKTATSSLLWLGSFLACGMMLSFFALAACSTFLICHMDGCKSEAELLFEHAPHLEPILYCSDSASACTSCTAWNLIRIPVLYKELLQIATSRQCSNRRCWCSHMFGREALYMYWIGKGLH